MAQIQLATKIAKEVKKAVETVCEERGWKMNRFIEEALVDKLEEFEDLNDLKLLRRKPIKPLNKIAQKLKRR